MMTKLDAARCIDPAALDGRQYLASLLAEGMRCGLLPAQDAEDLRTQSLALLAAQANALCAGHSSSIRVETARSILESIWYAAGVELKTAPTPVAALERLRCEGLELVYRAGQRRITRKCRAVRQVHRHLAQTLFVTPNVYYRATAVEGIASFLRLYRPGFAAQETHITLDYPLFCPLPPLTGIEQIEAYLQRFSWENRFCCCFSAQQVHMLLYGADKTYAHVPENLFGTVLATALCCGMAGRPVQLLDAGPEIPQLLFQNTPGNQISSALAQEALRLAQQLGLDTGTSRYLQSCVPRLAAQTELALRTDTLGVLYPALAKNT